MAVVSTGDQGTQINLEETLPENLREFLKKPRCLDIQLPKPKSMKVTLPTAGALPGVQDFTKGIPTDCSLSFSLLLQLGPFLANLECIIRILKIVKPLIDIVDGLPFPPPSAIKDFGEAAVGIAQCITALVVPLPLACFVRDVLKLIIAILSCLIDQMKSLLELINGISIQLLAAAGNDELTASLECAQENAQCAAASAMQSIEPVMVIFELIAPIMELAQLDAIEIPAIAPAEGTEQMEQIIATLEEFIDTLQLVVDAIDELKGEE